MAVYFEAAAVITVLVLLGQVLELRAREQTSGAITALLNLAPKTARRLDHDGHETDINAEDVLPGDKLPHQTWREYSGRRYRGRRQNNR